MVYQMAFHITEHIDLEGESFPLQESYTYWTTLMEHYLKQADTVEIHCWNEETEVIEETRSQFRDSFIISREGGLTRFEGSVTAEVADHLLHNHLHKGGRLKWFTIFLSKAGEAIFHSEHWGTEFFTPHVTQQEIEFIKSVMPEETSYNQYE